MTVNISLYSTAYTVAQLLIADEPQIAIVGRSNVGKSSLINALAARKNIARVSSTPGKTRSINYYLVSPYSFFIVDLPGYGYARTSHHEREKWNKIIDNYFASNRNLTALMLLLDCRLRPQGLDMEMANYAISHNLETIPVLTKIDKCTQRQRIQTENKWGKILGKKPLLVSTVCKTGLHELWDKLIFCVRSRLRVEEGQIQ